MTERKGHYFEVCIALDSAEFSEIFTSEIMDFCGEAVEIADNKIIVRTSKDRDFISALLGHLSDFGANLKAIWQKSVTFSHSIEKKQNRDWIEEYKKGIKPIRCGRFYICPPWSNSSLGMRFRTCENFGDFADTKSSLNPQNFHKYKSHTANTSIVIRDANQNAKNPSLLGSGEATTKQSKSHDLKRQNESRTEKRINKSNQTTDSALAHCDSYNLDSRGLDCFGDKSPRNDGINVKSATQDKQSKDLRCGFAPFSRETSEIELGVHRAQFDAKTAQIAYPKANCAQDDAKLINIILEPSLAFGTGHHASTFMCIQAIESLGENGGLKNKTLLDFGCGSGILALCAYKLGAKVDLCDIDELAIAESKKNFCNNNATISHIWQGEIHQKSKGDIAQKSVKYDIITANIIASVLIEQKENIASALKCGGVAILSGILDIYKDEVLARFSDFEVLNIAQKDEWICIMLRKF
ncbi:50S ribosomal protein L11 methyltransferase [Helicobacter sp. 23-1044]